MRIFIAVLYILSMTSCGAKEMDSQPKDIVAYIKGGETLYFLKDETTKNIELRKCPDLTTISSVGELNQKCPRKDFNYKLYDIEWFKLKFIDYLLGVDPELGKKIAYNKLQNRLKDAHKEIFGVHHERATQLKSDLADLKGDVDQRKMVLENIENDIVRYEKFAEIAGGEEYLSDVQRRNLQKMREVRVVKLRELGERENKLAIIQKSLKEDDHFYLTDKEYVNRRLVQPTVDGDKLFKFSAKEEPLYTFYFKYLYENSQSSESVFKTVNIWRGEGEKVEKEGKTYPNVDVKIIGQGRVTLVLNSRNAVHWNILPAEGVRVDKVMIVYQKDNVHRISGVDIKRTDWKARYSERWTREDELTELSFLRKRLGVQSMAQSQFHNAVSELFFDIGGSNEK